MRRTTALAVATAAAMAVIGVAPAAATHRPPDGLPDVPGIGEPGGVFGAGPQVAINGGRVWLGRANSVHIEVVCSTSTKQGCSGALELFEGHRAIGSSAFDLVEAEGESVFLSLPSEARRRARPARGWKLTAVATATDNLGRSGSDTASVRIRRRTR